LNYLLGLSAAYAPRAFPHRGEFTWLYDARGKFRGDIWQRWLANNPLPLSETIPLPLHPARRFIWMARPGCFWGEHRGAENI